MNGVNPKDPLPKSMPDQARALFNRLNDKATGFSASAVEDAALNLLVNALRQSYASRSKVEARFDELMGRTKSLLLSHYDGVTGNRRSVFPFTQYIRPPLVSDDDEFTS